MVNNKEIDEKIIEEIKERYGLGDEKTLFDKLIFDKLNNFLKGDFGYSIAFSIGDILVTIVIIAFLVFLVRRKKNKTSR